MRKFYTISLVIVLTIVFSACSNKTGTPKLLSKEGVAPYEWSENDTYLLDVLGIKGDTNIISFKAPQTAKSLEVNVYVLNEDGIWNVTGGGQVSLGEDANAKLEGTFAMMLKDDYAIDFNISDYGGRYSFQTDTLDVNYESISSLKGFLTDFQEIEMNKEIPVAMMIYDRGNRMRSYALEDFYSPSTFEGMDVVQAVTLNFKDKIN